MKIAKHFVYDTITDIAEVSSGARWPLAPTPFIDPDSYTLYGVSYDCTRPGLYRWKIPEEIGLVNLIVYGGDIYALMSGISWNHSHGSYHDKKSNSYLSAIGRSRKWRLTCGYITLYLMSVLPVQSRRVDVLTTGPRNGFDDGHTVIETFHDGAWRMWDMSAGAYFKIDGEHIDTATFVHELAAGREPEMIRLDGGDKYNAEMGASMCYGVLSDMIFRDRVWDWYRRIFQSIV
ncbi:MAG: hypothetical protein ACR2OV_15785 [Hyphomicrobiaceae bacterium]